MGRPVAVASAMRPSVAARRGAFWMRRGDDLPMRARCGWPRLGAAAGPNMHAHSTVGARRRRGARTRRARRMRHVPALAACTAAAIPVPSMQRMSCSWLAELPRSIKLGLEWHMGKWSRRRRSGCDLLSTNSQSVQVPFIPAARWLVLAGRWEGTPSNQVSRMLFSRPGFWAAAWGAPWLRGHMRPVLPVGRTRA